MLEKKFLEGIINDSITVEPSADPNEVIITVDKEFINENIYKHFECNAFVDEPIIDIKYNGGLIGRIYYDNGSFLNNKEALAYANMLVRKINKDLKEVLNVE